MFHEEGHTWTASGSLLRNWRFPTHFFHNYPPSLAVLRSLAMAHSTPTMGKISRTVSSPTHSLTSRILFLFDQYADNDESPDSFRPNAQERHNNLSLRGFFLTMTWPHHTARWLRTSDFEKEPPNLKKLSYITGLCNESVNAAWTT